MLKTMLKLYDGLTKLLARPRARRSSFGAMRSVGMKTETYPVDKFVPASAQVPSPDCGLVGIRRCMGDGRKLAKEVACQ